MNSDLFYNRLPVLQGSLEHILSQPTFFQPLPDDWHIIVTDIRESTQAVDRGQHEEVNMLAASSIIACINLAKRHGIEIPFVFGGDGATVAVPQRILDDILVALSALQTRGLTQFGLHIRVGHIPVPQIQAHGHTLCIAKFHVAEGYDQAMYIGHGLSYAETVVKSQSTAETSEMYSPLLDLRGLECRWNEIKPPSKDKEIISVIVQATQLSGQDMLYAQLLEDMNRIFGSFQERHPIRTIHLRLSSRIEKIKREAMTKFGTWYSFHIIPTFIFILIAKLYFRYNLRYAHVRGKQYLTQLVAATDNLTIDGVLKTVIAGTAAQREEFVTLLQAKEKMGKLLFGHHVSHASIITCFVQKRNAGHIHFLDGVGGGYTQAAKKLKQKLRGTNF